MSDLLARIKTHSLPRFLAVGVLNTLLSTVVMFVLYDVTDKTAVSNSCY